MVTSVHPNPPPDPDDWSDEQWLEWLKETDADYPEMTEHPRRAQWRDRRPSKMLGAAMLGAYEAIYGHKDDESVAIAEVPGGPPDDDQPQVHLDPEHPERSQVIYRSSRRTVHDRP